MKIIDFKIVLEPEEDGGYVAICPAIPGCYSQGDSAEEAMKNIKEAIELCIEVLQSEKNAFVIGLS